MEGKPKTSIRAIRNHCLKCQGGHPSLVRNCDNADCDLFSWRMGKNPNRNGIGGFQTHHKNVLAAGIEDSSKQDAKTDAKGDICHAPPSKPFITDELAEKMIKAATIIIDTTNSIKSTVA